MSTRGFAGLVATFLLFSLTFVAQVQATNSRASRGGTYFVEPGVRSEFQFSQSHVQCKIGHAVLSDGAVLQMRMFSTSVDSVTIDSAARTVPITGTMFSIVQLRFTNGTSATLTETVAVFCLRTRQRHTRSGRGLFLFNGGLHGHA